MRTTRRLLSILLAFCMMFSSQGILAMAEEVQEIGIAEKSVEEIADESTAEEDAEEPAEDIAENSSETEEIIEEVLPEEDCDAEVSDEESADKEPAEEGLLTEEPADQGTWGSLTWDFSGDGVLTISGNGAMDNYPSGQDIYDSPAELYPWGTHPDDLQKVVIEEGVTSLGNSVFDGNYYCNFTEISLPATLQVIGDWALANSQITEIELPEGLTSIGENALSGCQIKEVKLPGTLKSIGDRAFSNNYELETVVIADGITALTGNLFYECTGLKTIMLPNSVTRIEIGALGECNALQTVRFDYPKYINGSIAEINVASDNDAYVNADKNYTCLAEGTAGTAVSWILENDGTLKISGSGAIADNLSTSKAFSAVKGLVQSIEIGEGITAIGSNAFAGCSAVSVTIPMSVTAIGSNAFTACSSLTALNYDGTFEEWSAITVDDGNTALTALIAENYELVLYSTYTQSGVTFTYSLTKAGVLSVNGAGTVPEGFASKIGHASEIKKVVLGDDVTGVSVYCFENLPELEEVTWGVNFKNLGERAFSGCTSLSKYSIPSAAKSIGRWVFENTLGPEVLEIPASVEKIGQQAFYNTKNLKKLILHKNLTQIDLNAFQGSGVTEAEYDGTLEDWEKVDVKSGNAAIRRAVLKSYGLLAIGTCDSFDYSLTTDGVFTVTGTGEVPDYFLSELTSVVNREEIREIVLSEEITAIGSAAFGGCSNLKSIAFPSTLQKIGNSAFFNCSSLETLAIPETVLRIEASAFSGAASLKKITLSKNLQYVGDYVFSGCSSVEEVVYDGDLDSWNSILSGMANHTVRNRFLKQNGYYAMGILSKDGTSVRYELTTDGVLTVSGTGPMEISLRDGIGFEDKIKKIVVENGITSLPEYAFTSMPYGYTGVTEIVLGEDVMSIGGRAFAGMTSLKSVVLNKNLTLIGDSAFYECTALENISLGNKVGSLGESAFEGCENLKRVEFYAALKYISKNAFKDCTNIEQVIYHGVEKDWNETAVMEGNETLTSLMKKSIGLVAEGPCGEKATWILRADGSLTISGTGIAQGTFDAYKDSIKKIIVEEGINGLDDNFASGLAACTEIDLSDSLSSIGKNAFSGTGLSEIRIPKGVVTIETGTTNGSFCDAPNLKSITVDPENAQFASRDGALYNKDYTRLLFVPEGKRGAFAVAAGVEEIAPYAMYHSNLSSVVIPDSTVTIGEYAMADSKVERLTIGTGVKNVGAHAFSGCQNLTDVTLKAIVTNWGDHAFADCDALRSIAIPEGTESLGDSMFEGCDNLQNITLPATITGIGDDAFAGCSKLDNIQFGGSEEQWNEISKGSGNDKLTEASVETGTIAAPIGGPAKIAQGKRIKLTAGAVSGGTATGTRTNTWSVDTVSYELGVRINRSGSLSVPASVPTGTMITVDLVSTFRNGAKAKSSTRLQVVEPATTLEIRNQKGEVLNGKTIYINLSAKDVAGQLPTLVGWTDNGTEVTWRPSNTALTIKDGIVMFTDPVKGIKEAKNITVYATTADGSNKKANMKISFVYLTMGIEPAEGTYGVAVGKSIKLPAALKTGCTQIVKGKEKAILPTNRKVEWSIKDKDGNPTDIATVSNSGVVKGLKPGQAVVCVKAKDASGFTAKYEINVTTATLAVVLNKGTENVTNRTDKFYQSEVPLDTPIKLSAKIVPDDALRDVKWTCNYSTACAFVDNGDGTCSMTFYAPPARGKSITFTASSIDGTKKKGTYTIVVR